MHRGTIINSREDLQTMASSYSYRSTGFDNQSFHSNRQNHQHNYYETDHLRRPSSPSTNQNNERAKSVDYSRTSLKEAMPMGAPSLSTYTSSVKNPPTTSRSSRTMGTRSSTAYIEELHATQQEGEKHELNILNNRFGNYLDKIKHLATINAQLRGQVDDAYRKYMGQTDEELNSNTKNSNKKSQHPSEIQLNNLRKQINEEVRIQTSIQVRLQRADYDMKFYQKNMKLLTSHHHKQSEQVRIMRQQLEANLYELEQLKQQYEKREQDFKMYRTQYNELMNKLIEFSDQYDKITSERMQNENNLYTLKEQLVFEKEYYQRRQEEFEYLENFQYDFNKEFNKNEFHNIVKQIRQDYQEFNAIRLEELESLYKTKLETIQNEFIKRNEQQAVPKPRENRVALDSIKKEHRTLIEQNQLLQGQLEQLENDLQKIIEQNRQRYDISDREYQQLQIQLPELDYIIVQLRESAVSLWSEINTYRYLLLNLLSSTNEKSQPSKPIEKYTRTTSTTTDKNLQESTMTKPMINKLTTVGTKAKSSPQQYRDETTGFIVHIEDGLIWVRI